jgi:hypothetical protein
MPPFAVPSPSLTVMRIVRLSAGSLEVFWYLSVSISSSTRSRVARSLKSMRSPAPLRPSWAQSMLPMISPSTITSSATES